MSKRKEWKVSHDHRSTFDAFEGTSARTRPYSFEEILINRKNRKVSQDHHEIEAKGKEDQKLELLPTDDDEKSRKCSSHSFRNKNTENTPDITSRTKERRTSLKLESVIVGKVDVSPVEPKVKYNVVSHTRHKETLGKINAKVHKTIEKDELHYNKKGDRAGYIPLKSSLPERRSGDYQNEKSERDVKRKEQNSSDQKRNEDFLRAKYKRKVMYLEGEEKFGGKVEKGGRENKAVHRNDLYRKQSDKDIVHKHVVSKRDPEVSVRRERKCSPPPLREQSSKKVRRSSSREQKRDRDQKRSSDEVPKHNSYHRQSHVDSSSHSFEARSGKSASELDRSNKFTNGSTCHNRVNNESTDKLGGYSPRKRRSEDPIQSPPIQGTSGKKRVGWDIPQTESNIIVSSALLPMASIQSKPSKMPYPVGVLAVSSSQPQSAIHIEPIDYVQLTQSTQPMRRLIIENVPSTVLEKDVMDCLNKFLLPSGANLIQGTKPCFSCVIHAEKRQALVEFLTAEYASAALSFKGCPLLGSDFKIRRPKDFVAVETAAHEKSVAVKNDVSDIVEDSPHKIFIGGIPRNLSPKMLMEIVSAFGSLKAFKFLVSNDVDEPRAFLQYADQSITAKACAGLNGMKLGGQTLTVIQAATNKPSLSDIKSPPTYEIPEIAMPLLADPTEVLVLKNVLDPEQFPSLSQPEIQEALEDVRLECARFGTVKSINVVTSIQSSSASLETNECGAAKLVPTESINYANSRDSNAEVGSSKQMEKEHYDGFMKSDNPNAEEPPNIKIADSDSSVNGKEKQAASDSALSSELLSMRSEAFNKPSSLVDETTNADYETKGNIGKHDPTSVGENKHSLSFPSELNARMETLEEANKEQKGSRQFDGLLPGSICIEFRRSEATSIAAHCFNGRVFDNRIVSVEYLPLDIYRSKFPK